MGLFNKNIKVYVGRKLPLGSTFRHSDSSINFAIFSRHATSVKIAIFKNSTDTKPYASFNLFKTGDIWHIGLANLARPIYYNYQIDGCQKCDDGHRYNKDIYLLDPYARDLTADFVWDFSKHINPKSIVYEDSFDWQDDKPPLIPMEQTIIYETHLKGFTASPKSEVKNNGTYLGLVEKIPYLKSLGITAIELLPIMEFDEYEYTKDTDGSLRNYWGYSTISFFTPRHRYASNVNNAIIEFKTMVRELHKNNLEVILDVVFNHTNEGNEMGPTISFKGIDNSIFYMLYTDKNHYWNYSGCGNTFNCNHPIVAIFIVDALLYWVEEMHVDGFRFDLGSILSRDTEGNIIKNPIVLELIAEHPLLRNTKLISEPWDAGGGYQVGSFPRGDRFSEWNDLYRDDVRRFWRNDSRMSSAFATRLAGSSDIYHHQEATHSINYITAHDGFTLNDLVSYNNKHNEANSENNSDGSTHNNSYNFGHEGDSDDKRINQIRDTMVKNHILTLALSIGVPMFTAGDEVKRTQKGNNNAYCQDNDISYFDWSLLETNSDILRFFKEALKFRKSSSVLRKNTFYTGTSIGGSPYPDISWYDNLGQAKDWSSDSNLLMCRISGDKILTGQAEEDSDILLLLNPSPNETMFNLPNSRESRTWLVKVDTSEASPFDIRINGQEEAILNTNYYYVKAYASVVLTCHAKK